MTVVNIRETEKEFIRTENIARRHIKRRIPITKVDGVATCRIPISSKRASCYYRKCIITKGKAKVKFQNGSPVSVERINPCVQIVIRYFLRIPYWYTRRDLTFAEIIENIKQ